MTTPSKGVRISSKPLGETFVYIYKGENFINIEEDKNVWIGDHWYILSDFGVGAWSWELLSRRYNTIPILGGDIHRNMWENSLILNLKYLEAICHCYEIPGLGLG